MQLAIEQVTKSKSGKALRVKANGAWFGARLNSKLDTLQGKTIDAEVKHDETYGDQIEAYKVLDSATPAQPPAQQRPNGAAHPAANGSGAPAWLPFASNTVAHAISAGLIQEAGQVSAWAKAAKEAFEALA